MGTPVTRAELGKRLSALRKSKGFSQEDLARLINLSRSSVAQMELGNRDISVTELLRLSESLGFSLDRFLAREYVVEPVEIQSVAERDARTDMRVSVPVLKAHKLRNVLLYLLEKCSGKPNVGETVLNKLLYFADFNFYEIYEEHLTGAQYRKLPYGPVPHRLDTVLAKMVETGQLQRINTDYHGYPQTRYIPLVKPDLTEMSAAEKEVIDQVIDRFSDWSASAISDYSHRDLPWKATEEGDVIDYELAFYREPPFSVRTYSDEPERP